MVTEDSIDIPLDLQTFTDNSGNVVNDSCDEETNAEDRFEVKFNKILKENNFVYVKTENQIDNETINYSNLLLISNKKETRKISSYIEGFKNSENNKSTTNLTNEKNQDKKSTAFTMSMKIKKLIIL